MVGLGVESTVGLGPASLSWKTASRLEIVVKGQRGIVEVTATPSRTALNPVSTPSVKGLWVP